MLQINILAQLTFVFIIKTGISAVCGLCNQSTDDTDGANDHPASIICCHITCKCFEIKVEHYTCTFKKKKLFEPSDSEKVNTVTCKK